MQHPKQGDHPSSPTPRDDTSASPPEVVKPDTAPTWIAVTHEDAAHAIDEFGAEAPVASDDFAELALETGADQPAVAPAIEVANDAEVAATAG